MSKNKRFIVTINFLLLSIPYKVRIVYTFAEVKLFLLCRNTLPIIFLHSYKVIRSFVSLFFTVTKVQSLGNCPPVTNQTSNKYLIEETLVTKT
ncbi:MAG: hypothetical protein AB1432_15420 [Bacteroidota bacterium]